MLERLLYPFYERRLLAGIARGPLPRHVGLIQDGHRRWAREAGLADLAEGYRRGAETTERVLEWCAELRIPLVTLWWLSTENLFREPHELEALIAVIEARMTDWMRDRVPERLGMRICPIGRLESLPLSLVQALQTVEAATRHLDRMRVNVGVGYGGREEILDAFRGYLRDAFMRGEAPEEILAGLGRSDAVEKYLYTPDCPDPDLIIRTSGEVRLSGFLLWQSAYSEFYFCDAYWPAFRKIDFLRAIRSYQQRQRRFGR
ncbi:MAG TPA: polyprenyl diphosphate synthase [Candidatus Binatia bacterium]|nr:polyprenyl diphosphate synthase [Candidatus Binatia bacterium]